MHIIFGSSWNCVLYSIQSPLSDWMFMFAARLAGQTSLTDTATIVIAVVCSLIGVLLLSALAIFCCVRHNRGYDSHPKCTHSMAKHRGTAVRAKFEPQCI